MSQGLDTSKVTFTPHFIAQARSKGFSPQQIVSALRNPTKVTDVRRYPGQLRYCGAGVAVVCRGNIAVTVYLDGIVTPLRADQTDSAARNSRRINR